MALGDEPRMGQGTSRMAGTLVGRDRHASIRSNVGGRLMNFVSAQELYAHLSEIIDDEEFILRSVRVHFPAFKKDMRNAAKKVRPAPPDPYGPHSVIQHDAMVSEGSKRLLKALHDEHPGIMQFAAAKGRLVVYP